MDKKQTILFITHYPGMYGANKSMCHLILELRASYNINPLVLLRSEGQICDFLRENQIPFFISHFFWWVYEGNGYKKKLLNFIKRFRNYSRVNKIIKLLNNQSINLVYTNSIVINIGVLISRKLNCPHLWHIRETLEAYDFKFSLGTKISKSVLQNGADRFIVISHYLSNWYKNLLPAGKVEVIYNGVEPEQPLRIINTPDTILNLCVLGILCDQKNQAEAIDALDILVNSLKINTIRLHFIGGKREDYFTALKKKISDKKLDNYIIFHGHSNEVSKILNTMNLGLVCARNEGFGRVTVEFMLNRIPVIASISGANAELIDPGKNGELYKLGDSKELANKIGDFIANTKLLESMGANAQIYALKNFSSEQNSKKIYQVIKEILEN